ncbi:MAG: gamma-glutamyl-gamma-aminobutyrate hydrolase family protein [Eubacteriales bacterium]|nr:gamma-glutamyl-gamma-aminobutyrate hydrolase family protein [Eubacteriales bacterium]
MRPVIGVIPLYDDEKDSYWMLPGYMKVLQLCNALPVMLPLSTDHSELDQLFAMCDGILLTGGHDVGPEVYGEAPKETCGVICKARDEMEIYLLRKAMNADLPVLGICRGIQLMNAALGGNLYQDLPTESESMIDHHMTAPYDRTAHTVKVLPDTLLADMIGSGIHEVNSYHHQAVKNLSPLAEVMAVSKDGLAEAISVKEQKFMMGVQWHPEFSYESNPDSKKIVQAFIDACNINKQHKETK